MDQSPAAAAIKVALKLVYNIRAVISAVRRGDTETVVDLLDLSGVPIDTKDGEGNSLLHWAASGGHVTTMRLLIRRGCDVDSVDGRGLTPLHWAAAMGQTKAVRGLIRMGATKSMVAIVYGTPLHQAAISGHVETVEAMLEEGCAIDEVRSNSGKTTLHSAAEGGHVEVIKVSVDRGCDVNAVDANGCTPLHSAACWGRTEAVHELIKLGATKSVFAGNFGTPLHQATLSGHVETVEAMLAEGCPIDVVDSIGGTVLHCAAQCGQVEVMRVLVDRGCDVNAVDANGSTPLHFAAGCGRTETVRELIRLGASKSVVAGNCGTPLHQATLSGHMETVEAMLAEGCPIDVMDSNGKTVLHCAAAGGNVEVIKVLVSRGCDMNAVKANGWTPLHFAAACGRTEAVRELIRLGATKSVIAGNFGTPLHQAAFAGHVETVEVLLEDDTYEPDLSTINVASSQVQIDSNLISVCDSVGETPVMYAAQGGQVEVFKLLTSKGGAITDKDTHSLSTLEQCFVGGHASKLSQFCEACGIGSSGEGLRGALATLITKGLVDAHKVLCLCAFSGDSVFLEEQFIELVASDECLMPAAVRWAKHYFHRGEGVPFIDQLHLLDGDSLSPLHISLLSLKCFRMDFADSFNQKGTNNHTSFITKLLSHPVLKGTVNEPYPNGLSLLDLARQFELPKIADLIEGTGGRPGVWSGIPQEIEVKHPLALPRLKEAYASIKAIAEDSEHGFWFIKSVLSSCLQQPLWHPNAAIVGADVGAERDDHEYKSLMEYVDGVSQPLSTLRGLHERVNKATYRKAINAMLNIRTGGCIHFGIGDDGIVEEGLNLKQNRAIDELRKKVGDILNSFWPPVESSKAQVEPVNLRYDNNQLTGRWRFDIVVKPCKEGVKVDGHAYHRVGPQTVRMTEDQFTWRFMETASDSRKSRPKPGGRSHGQPLPHEERPMKGKSGSDSRQSDGRCRKGQKEPSQKHSKKKGYE